MSVIYSENVKNLLFSFDCTDTYQSGLQFVYVCVCVFLVPPDDMPVR